ncbi:M1 family metallopeptidase [Streptomyces sp. NPDC007088]|uniref:M1 family metallopeptidase n=1 Tax=Streptomyces sp. NPDC007088 TaxID=3364773 RepID=UPI00367658B9
MQLSPRSQTAPSAPSANAAPAAPSPRAANGACAPSTGSAAAGPIAVPRRTPSRTVRRLRAGALAAVCLSLLVGAAPAPEARGIGDRLFPGLGNPGFDVTAYDLAFTYSGDNRKPLDAVTTIDARATAALDRVNLDFAHGTVRSVTVNGAPAGHVAVGQDLVLTPDRPVEEGEPLRITVRHTSDPRTPAESLGEGGWVRTEDGLAMANQADAAHRVFPGSDHPSDKARFTFHVTVPKGLTAVANGLPTGRTPAADGATTWSYRTAHPMATELAQVSIGRSAVLRRGGPHGVPVRDVIPEADRTALEPWLAKTPGQIAWMERRVGRYPFETYGVLAAGATTGFELETQTLSLFERRMFTEKGYPKGYVDSVMVHELSHQWFGDSVSPRTWSDLWLNEGHASWYEALYAAEKGGTSLEKRMRAAYGRSDAWRASGGAPAAPKEPGSGKISIFRPVVYDGSALVLYALRQEIGAPAFEELERAWVREHRDSTASTADFVRLASRTAGRDLDGLLTPWLYGSKTPPMPGHPDWKQTSEKPKAATRPGPHPAHDTAK